MPETTNIIPPLSPRAPGCLDNTLTSRGKGRNWEIYTLSDPRSLSVRYVGISTNARRRFAEHLERAKHDTKTHCARWVRSLIAQGLTPILAVIERGAGKSRVTAEQQWIALYRSTCNLTNLTCGGDGTLGHKHSPEARAKIGAALKGRKCPPETLAKMSAAQKGRKCSLETRAKLSVAARNRSPEYRAKISAALKGRIITAEWRAKLSVAEKGRVFTAEHRAKLGAALKGRIITAEWRAKLSAAHKGHQPSPETRAKISAAKRGKPWSAAHRKAQKNKAENQKEGTNE